MDRPGKILRAERENQKRSLKDVSKRLKVKIEYLEAIENDNFSLLPAEVFTKAYLRIYADLLGLDPGNILNLYSDLTEKSTVVKPVPSGSSMIVPKIRNVLSSILKIPRKPALIIVVFILIILSAVMFSMRKEGPAVGEFTELIEEPRAAEEQKAEEMVLQIIAVELTWISVRIDSGTPKEWLLRPGDSVTVNAGERFALKIGNAGGTKLILNSRELGKLGPHGKVIDIVLP